jgi:hypothetical protein
VFCAVNARLVHGRPLLTESMQLVHCRPVPCLALWQNVSSSHVYVLREITSARLIVSILSAKPIFTIDVVVGNVLGSFLQIAMAVRIAEKLFGGVVS